MPNFKTRYSQLKMVNIIDKCFSLVDVDNQNGNNICLVEAPTGTGKSLAYLLAGVVNAQKIGKKLVITTATKTLQAQLAEKDIPNFIKYSRINFSYAIAKGRSNYLCPYQLELSMSETQPDMFLESDKAYETLGKISEIFLSGRWDGDLDNAPIGLDNKIKKKITIDKDSCLNNVCPYNQKDECQCPYFKKRAELKFSDVIVTNHSLLLSDIGLGGGTVLPVAPENYILCIDEGHSFADVAINSLAGNFALKASISSCNNLSKFIHNPDTKLYIFGVEVVICEEVVDLASSLIEELNKILLILVHNTELFKDSICILNDYIEPKAETFKDYFVNCAFIAGELCSKLTKIQEQFKTELKENVNSTIEANLSKLGFYIAEFDKILITSQYIINKDDSRYNANARWVEIKQVKTEIEFIINAGRTHVGNLLFNRLFSRVYASAIVSATLAIGSNFNYYLHKLGLNLYSEVITSKLDASFCYATQSQVVVPRFTYSPDYSTRNEFTKELTDYLIRKVLDYNDGYGTLVLFFNRSQLQEVYGLLPEVLQQKVLLQTEYISSHKLINDHKNNIDKGLPSIIFGLNSFAEGVDLPSLYCIHVVISKLPFETHKNPVNLVQEYWFDFEKTSYFKESSLPETCIKLVQAAGRLIRSETDYGQLTICDSRIISKGYGAILLNALPPFNRVYKKDFILQAYHKIRYNVA